MQKHIPTLTDLVVTGDPKLKDKAQKIYAVSLPINELNMRIDELENTIGQNNTDPIGRAFAIRAETSDPASTRNQKKTQALKKYSANYIKSEEFLI